MPFHPLLFSWNGPPASIFAVPQSHHQGAREMKQFCPGIYHAGVAVKPPTLKGTTGRARVTTQRDPLHRVGHRPQFPAEAPHGAMGSIPISSTPSSHCMRVRVDTGIKLQMSSSLFQLHPFVSSWLHPGGDGYGARDWLPVWGVATGKRSGH